MLVSALRRKRTVEAALSAYQWAALRVSAASSQAGDQAPEGRNSAKRWEPPPSRPAPCVVQQKVGLKDVSARIHAGRVHWCHGPRHREDENRTSPPPRLSILSAARRWIGNEIRHLNEHAVDQFKALFLPVGFPDTVKDNYVRYSAMAALTNLLISTNMTLSSALLLYAVGLGSAAVPMAGALNWVIKEGVGQAGTLLLGRMVAHDFDLNTRTWYFVANGVVACACLAEIMTVYHPAYFIVMASIANTLKGVSMMAGGSTRAAFNISFAQGENIADITAKATSQYICTSLLGTCIGIIISAQVSSNVGAALLVSCTISGIASVLTYATIRSVPLANLNSTRLQLLIHHYRGLAAQRAAPGVVALPRPSALCVSDPVIVLPFMRQHGPFHPAIEVNTPLAELLHPALDAAAVKLCALVDTHRAARHMVLREGRQRASKLHVVLHKKATPEDAIAAMLHAVLFRAEVQQHEEDVLPLEEELRILRETLRTSQQHRDALLVSLRKADWNMNRVCIEGHPCRGTW